MKKLTLVMLILVFALSLSFQALAKPEQVSVMKANPKITYTTEANYDYIDISMAGATNIGDTYHIYYTTYDEDDRKLDEKWLMQNGKLSTYQTETKLNVSKRIHTNINTTLVFTITLVDKKGNESNPTTTYLVNTKYTEVDRW